MPGFYQPGEYDLSGTIVGVVEKSRMLDGKTIRPGDAVIGRNDGNYVAVVDQQHKVHFSKVDVARDFGAKVAVRSGVTDGDMVVLSPGDEVREGAKVEIRTASESR